MVSALSRFPALIGKKVLPFTNQRVVAPPGRILRNGHRNIIVATPKRSGTHVLIDMILNNIPAYCGKPLYVDLDQCLKEAYRGRPSVEAIASDAGYVLKTHIPFETDPAFAENADIDQLIKDAFVITVRRHEEAIIKSLNRWRKDQSVSQSSVTKSDAIAQFWSFWESRQDIEVGFPDLFDANRMKQVLHDICQATNTVPRTGFTGPMAQNRPFSIHKNKFLTRLMGHHAPRVDTTIHTLKG